MGKTKDFTPFEKELILGAGSAEALISKTANPTVFSKPANPPVFSKTANPTVFSKTGTSKVFKMCFNRHKSSTKALPNGFQLDPCTGIAKDRNALSGACEKTTRFCPKCKNSFAVVSGKNTLDISGLEMGIVG
ncbi:hypothetical protein TNCV_2671621 [Trichonephila clavipes]|nr:hypothetical protein TNCV_2671621 [Trichonephila clavipes]